MAITQQEVVASHMHVGNLKKFASTKTRSFWLDMNQGLVVINPDKIAAALETAKEKFHQAKKDGKEILILCEKSLMADEIPALAKKHGFHYMNYKVPAGFLTNFDTLITRIAGMNQLESFTESEDFNKITKKEQLTTKRKLAKVQQVYAGVKTLKRKPDLVIVVDGKAMMKFVKELKKLDLDNIVLAGTNFDTWRSDDKLVVLNVDAYQSVKQALHYILGA
jgi:small subunit ribosomal protein S2